MLKKLVDLLSDSAVYGLSSVLAQVVGFLLLPLYTRYLGPSDYGTMAMLALAAALFHPLANLGLTNAIFRRFNLCKDDADRRVLLGTGLVAVTLTATTLLVACLVFAGPVATALVGDERAAMLLQIACVSAALASVGDVPLTALRADRRVRTIALVNVANVMLSVSVTIVLVVGWELGVLGVLLGALVADALGLVVLFAMTRSMFRLALDFPVLRSMLSYGLPFLPHRLQSITLGMFGQYMIRQMLGLGQAGLYAIAARATVPGGFVVQAIQRAWVPYKFKVYAEERAPQEVFRSIVTYYASAMSYLWLGVCVWGPEVVRLMTPPAFHEAAILVPAVALAPMSRGLYYMLGTGIEMSDDTKAIPLVSLGALATVVVGAYVLIPPLGPSGAAFATFAGWVVMTSLIYVLSQKRYRIRYDWAVLRQLGGALAVCIGISVAVQSAAWPTRATVAALVSLGYPLLVYTILVQSPAERGRMLVFRDKLGARYGWSGGRSVVR